MKKILAILLAIMLMLGLCGCGTSGDEYPRASESDVFGDIDLSYAESPGESAVAAYSPASGSSSDAAAANAEKLVYRAEVTIATTDFDSSLAALDSLVGNFGGFIESSDVTGGRNSDGSARSGFRSASYVLRVPCERFREALDHAGELGSVTSSSTSVENITQQFVDRTARKHSLELQEQRLLALLEQSDSLETILELESRLADVRYDIESLESTLRGWQQQVDYSTICVYLREVETYSPAASGQQSFGEELGGALSDGWNGLVAVLRGLALFAARFLPVILLIAAVVTVVMVLSSRYRKKQRRMMRSAEQNTDQNARTE